MLLPSDREKYVEKVTKMKEILPSTLCFESIMAWNHACEATYCIREDFFCIRILERNSGENYYYMPLGEYREDRLQRLTDCLWEWEKPEESLLFCDVGEEQLDWFRKLKGYRIQASSNPGYSDYIYSAEDFRKSLDSQKARYNCRYFMRRFQPQTLSLEEAREEEAVELVERTFCVDHDCRDCGFGCLKKTIAAAIQKQGELEAKGVLVRVDGRAAGYAVGAVQNRTLVFLFKKNDRSFRGLDEYLHQCMLELFRDEADVINYTEDMNRVGIRQYKERLAPYRLLPKYKIRVERQR